MSDENRLQTEEDLWDVLSEPVVTETKSKPAPKVKPAPKAKSEGRFARPEPAGFKPEEPAVPAPKQEGRKLDGFFFACMAGVATVSVAATLILGSMFGGEKPAAPTGPVAPVETNPGFVQEIIATENTSELENEIARLELENAELQSQLMLQKQQIQNLQADLIALKGSDAVLSTAPTGSGEDAALLEAQVEAHNIFTQIQEAYANFDRAKLEELIPQMDKRLGYLSSEALTEYYLILEYVEQPSNG